MVVIDSMLKLDLDIRDLDILLGGILRGNFQDQALLVIINGILADVSHKLTESKRRSIFMRYM